MKTKFANDGFQPDRTPVASSALVGVLSQVSQSLVKAALNGVGDAGLVALLGNTLTAAGLDIATIEVACDAVDPERAQHFIRWRRSVGGIDGSISAHEVFQAMLEDGTTML